MQSSFDINKLLSTLKTSLVKVYELKRLFLVDPVTYNEALKIIALFYIVTSFVLVGATKLGIQVQLFIGLLPFMFFEVLQYRALWYGRYFYNTVSIVYISILSLAFSFSMMAFDVTEGSPFYMVILFVIAGILFGHMRYVLIRYKQIKESKNDNSK